MLTLVLLPGLDGTGDLFDSFIAAAGANADIRVVRYPPDQPLGYAPLEAHARAALPDAGDYVLLGESFSGPIAISIAASAPPGLKGVVLCCTFARCPLPALTWLGPLVSVLPVAHAPLAALDWLLAGRYSSASLRAALRSSLAQVAPEALRARLRAVMQVDVREKLSRVGLPVLCLQAAHDRTVPRAASQLILSLRPQTELVELDAPHFLLQTVPGEAWQVVSAFAQRACAI
ncbi:MAG: alpha/beta hydrolase [Aquabacterium sp.]|nr:MAG: alpha/beta hydrolase [Aquabacterium sp.]